MHKNTKLLPYQRQAVYQRWCQGETVVALAEHYLVSRPTIYKIIKRAKLGVFDNMTSMNWRYRQLAYGLKKLTVTERKLAAKLARREHRLKRFEKDTPGEMVHFDTKTLPKLPFEAADEPREVLHIAIDDFSRTLFADILPDKTQYSSAIFLEETRRALPFAIECAYSDNGPEYKGRSDHAFVELCEKYQINQRFTRPHRPQTNGKAERVIQTLMREWYYGRHFTSRQQRRKFLYAYVSWYNQLRPHQSLGGQSPTERLETFLARVKGGV